MSKNKICVECCHYNNGWCGKYKRNKDLPDLECNRIKNPYRDSLRTGTSIINSVNIANPREIDVQQFVHAKDLEKLLEFKGQLAKINNGSTDDKLLYGTIRGIELAIEYLKL